MTREAFIKELDSEGYSYKIEGDKIVITHKAYVNLALLETLPPDVVFRNSGYVGLSSLKTLSPGVKFEHGNVNLYSLVGGNGRFSDWSGNIDGIEPKRLLNKMIELGLFDRR